MNLDDKYVKIIDEALKEFEDEGISQYEEDGVNFEFFPREDVNTIWCFASYETRVGNCVEIILINFDDGLLIRTAYNELDDDDVAMRKKEFQKMVKLNNYGFELALEDKRDSNFACFNLKTGNFLYFDAGHMYNEDYDEKEGPNFVGWWNVSTWIEYANDDKNLMILKQVCGGDISELLIKDGYIIISIHNYKNDEEEDDKSRKTLLFDGSYWHYIKLMVIDI